MTAHRHVPWLAPALVVLLPLAGFGAYMGGYYAMLERVSDPFDLCFGNTIGDHSPPPISGVPVTFVYPVYRYGNSTNDLVTRFFAPAHRIDRWARPGVWYEDSR